MGFPSGLSGNDLANRGYLQALKFGAQFIAPITVQAIESNTAGEHETKALHRPNRSSQMCVDRQWRHLSATETSPAVANLKEPASFTRPPASKRDCARRQPPSSSEAETRQAQAAMFLANSAKCVKLLIRGDDLSKSMSSYLCERVLAHSKIEVMPYSEVAAIEGDTSVSNIQIRNNQSNEITSIGCAGLFIFIGARPHSDWLPDEIKLDEKGFVVTGAAIAESDNWPLERNPCELETSISGIMAAGDVRGWNHQTLWIRSWRWLVGGRLHSSSP